MTDPARDTTNAESAKLTDEAIGFRGGLLHALRLDGRGGGQGVEWPEIDADPMGSLVEGDLWIHMNRAAPRVQQWLTETARVPEQAAELLLAEDPRPKFVPFEAHGEEPEGFVLVLRGVNLNPDSDPENMVSVRLWVDEHRVISLRRRKVVAVEALRDSIRHGRGAADSAQIVDRLIGEMLDRIDPVLDEVEEELADAERLIEGGSLAPARQRIGAVRRGALRLRRYLGPQRDLVVLCVPELPAWVERTERLRLRSKGERLSRIVEDLDELIARAGYAQDDLQARLDERTNRISTGLTLVATVFLPMGLVASLWGINAGGVPLARSDAGFWVVSVLVLMLGAGCAWVGLRLSRLG